MIEVYHVIYFNLLLYLIIFFLGYNSLKKGHISKQDFRIMMVLFVVFCMYPAWGGDYFHYRESFPAVKQGWSTHMEDFYVFIIQNITATYLQFRIIVWGGAIYLLYQAYKHTDVDTRLAMLMFSLLFLTRFSYARASLAMAMSYLGLSLIVTEKKKRSIIFGYVLLAGSFFFHKSALFGIAVVLLTIFISERIGKKTLIVILAAFPFLIAAATYFLSDFLLLDADEFELLNVEKGQQYLTEEVSNKGLAARLGEMLFRLTFYSILIEYLVLHVKGLYAKLPKSVKAYSTASFFTIIISSLFAFDLGVSTQVIYNRFIFFAMIPSACFIAYCLEVGLLKKWTKFVIALGVSSVVFALLYACYLAPNSPYTW